MQRIRADGRIRLLGRHEIAFDEPLNLLFHVDQVLPGHSNGMRFTAHDAALEVLAREEYYSIGGGFIVQAGAEAGAGEARAKPPYEFDSGARLLELATPGGTGNPRADAGARAHLVRRGRNTRAAACASGR